MYFSLQFLATTSRIGKGWGRGAGKNNKKEQALTSYYNDKHETIQQE